MPRAFHFLKIPSLAKSFSTWEPLRRVISAILVKQGLHSATILSYSPRMNSSTAQGRVAGCRFMGDNSFVVIRRYPARPLVNSRTSLMPRRDVVSPPFHLPHAVSVSYQPDLQGDRHVMEYCRFQHNRCDRASSGRVEPWLARRVVFAVMVAMAGPAWSRATADETNVKRLTDSQFPREAVDFFSPRVRPIFVGQRASSAMGPRSNPRTCGWIAESRP